MSEAGRERFDELVDAYALGALSDEERREFEDHLSEHPDRQPEVDERLALAGLLALSPMEQEPSPALRKQLMRTVRAEATQSEPAGIPFLDRIRNLFGYQALAFGAAAIALIGLLSWNLLLQGEVQNLRNIANNPPQPTVASNGNGNGGNIAVNSDPRVLELQAAETAGSASGELIVLEGQKGLLVTKDLPPIRKGQVLQIWVIEGDKPKSGGLFQPDEEGPVAASITRPARKGDVVAITVEPAGGSSAPTSDPILTTQL